ncbi:T9SS type A sorting domain-containing protein [Hymenobacter properus]|uniref:T9SS type A sorting domain-containing protein n=1 Tax=Hymenobacter properus TaxID=2791026 RepID=A0A931FKA4_9BACT|nr:T9SS type A sorting domain-containing protein [Hymenobacter properus]MBF9143757.1 T9SS type A sorting domain-containing protein [Hymenobacter properus]MBR7722570.1 T9SS type A sorting domain-containing protein [Microvirga sp. SRT04]
MQNSTLKLSFLLAFLLSATMSMAQTITTVGIIGSATPITATNPTGWDASTPMTRTTATGNDWTITLPLTVGEVKFRADNAWTVNWGANTFPTGTGTQGGPNIPIATAGRYTVRFNSSTGVYQFSIAAAAKNSFDAVLKLAIAPNPASGTAYVNYNLPTAGTATLTLQNALGQTVRQFAPVRQGVGAQGQALPLTGIAAGLYLLRLETADMAQTTRLVVE